MKRFTGWPTALIATLWLLLGACSADDGWRAQWTRGLALGRTGYASGNIIATAGNDSCGNAWNEQFPPARAGITWLATLGDIDKLMITDGGLINDQQSVGGGSWSDTLSAMVACNAMEALEGPINQFLDFEHRQLNPATFKEKGKPVNRKSPRVKFVRQMPAGVWADALDVPAGMRAARCWYETFQGNGINPEQTINVLDHVEKRVPALIRLWVGAAPGVADNLTAIKDLYKDAGVKQFWVQYPYMDQAQVVLRGTDLKLLWNVVSPILHQRWNAQVTIPAVDPGLAPRIRQVSDDLNQLMFTQAGCAGFAAAHGPVVCSRNAGKPSVVVTRSAYPGWGPADHQTTVIGGMPHESPAGADKLGAGINAADALP